MKATISFLVFAVHYNLAMFVQYLGQRKAHICSRYAHLSQHVTFFGVNLFFLATYDTIKELILPFGLIGLGVFFLVSRGDW